MLVLASRSEIRATLLRNAGVLLTQDPAEVYEDALRGAISAEPEHVAGALAEAKSQHVSSRHPTDLVLGADQVLDFQGATLAKPATPDDARDQLRMLSGHTHRLHSAAVISENGRCIWRHTSSATLTMRPLSDQFIDAYLGRNWASVRHCVGCYRIEEEGPRLFSRLEGDHFAILGLPLIEVLSYLVENGRLTV